MKNALPLLFLDTERVLFTRTQPRRFHHRNARTLARFSQEHPCRPILMLPADCRHRGAQQVLAQYWLVGGAMLARERWLAALPALIERVWGEAAPPYLALSAFARPHTEIPASCWLSLSSTRIEPQSLDTAASRLLRFTHTANALDPV